MKKSIIYYLLLAFTLPMQLFPLEFHYFMARPIAFFIQRVAQYRRGVVARNISNSFPNKTKAEKKLIEKKFYQGFVETFVEILYFTHINLEKEQHRLRFENYEVLGDLFDRGKNVMVVMGHFGNWEFIGMFKRNIKSKIFFVYKKLNNKTMDKFFRDLRGRNGGIPLEMKQTFRTLYNEAQQKNPFLALFISDQRPLKGEIKHWVTFMGQDTPMMLGTEKLAKKTGCAVVYIEMMKTKPGYCNVGLELICEDASKTADYEITDKFMALLEKSINKAPEQYLWTHNRWKFKKNEVSNSHT